MSTTTRTTRGRSRAFIQPPTPSTTPAPTTIPSPQSHKPVKIPHAPTATYIPEPAPPDTKPVTRENKAIFDVFQQILTRLEQIRPQDHQRRAIECYFCSATGHRIRECPQVELSIRAGKCMRNAEERIVLPSGARIPNIIPGHDLREKFDEYHRRSLDSQFIPINETPDTLLYETSSPSPTTAAFNLDQKICFLEQEIQRLSCREFAKNAPSPVSISVPYAQAPVG
ncbi:hypothetical protein H0H81_008146, partial [Sphagnurus paluster]